MKGDTGIVFEKVYLGDTKNLDYTISQYIEVDALTPETQEEVVND